jgi:phage terminase small subunit
MNKDGKLVAAMIDGATVAEGSRSAGMSERTAHRRLKDPEVKAAIWDGRAAVVEDAIEGLCGLIPEALKAVKANLASDRLPDRLKAAKMVFESIAVLRREIEFDDRIAALERQFEDEAFLKGGSNDEVSGVAAGQT